MTASSIDIWSLCHGQHYITPLKGLLYRLVESQEQVATRQWVDTLEEQQILEEMLECSKPSYPQNIDTLHYLLKTPFRYPPLKWGSRFGRISEPSIFYGACHIQTTLAESAYYRFVFWHSMQGHAIKKSLRSQHSLFSVGYQSQKGIQLQCPPFDHFVEYITHPTDYQHSQRLGTAMRNAEIALFEYPSARANHHALCVGLFNANCFSQSSPLTKEHWFCDVDEHSVTFRATERSDVNPPNIVKFDCDEFKQQGIIPMPASH